MTIDLNKMSIEELQKLFVNIFNDIYLVLFHPKKFFLEHALELNSFSKKFVGILIYTSVIIMALAVSYGIKTKDAFSIPIFIGYIIKLFIFYFITGSIIFVILKPLKPIYSFIQVMQTFGIVYSIYSIVVAVVYFAFLSLEDAWIFYILYFLLAGLFISLSISLNVISKISCIKIASVILSAYIFIVVICVGGSHITGHYGFLNWLQEKLENPLSKELKKIISATEGVVTIVNKDDYLEWHIFTKESLTKGKDAEIKYKNAKNSKDYSSFVKSLSNLNVYKENWYKNILLKKEKLQIEFKAVEHLDVKSKHASELRSSLIKAIEAKKRLLEAIIEFENPNIKVEEKRKELKSKMSWIAKLYSEHLHAVISHMNTRIESIKLAKLQFPFYSNNSENVKFKLINNQKNFYKRNYENRNIV